MEIIDDPEHFDSGDREREEPGPGKVCTESELPPETRDYPYPIEEGEPTPHRLYPHQHSQVHSQQGQVVNQEAVSCPSDAHQSQRCQVKGTPEQPGPTAKVTLHL